MIEVGKMLPDFVFEQVTESDAFSLSSLRGRNVVIYFYPKDNTPGCISEAKSFQLLYSQFVHINTLVFGISKDTMESHLTFKQALELSYGLVSDTDEALCQLFNVIKSKVVNNEEVKRIERSTFLIDKHGVLQHEWRKVRIDNHVSDVFQAAEALENHRTDFISSHEDNTQANDLTLE